MAAVTAQIGCAPRKLRYGDPMSDAYSQNRPLIDQRLALLTIIGFWIFLGLITTLRSAVLEFPDQFELAGRRVVVTVIGIMLTYLLYLFLRMFDRKHLGVRITAVFIGSIPCSLAISAVNYYVFNIYDPVSLFEDADLGQKVQEVEDLLGMTALQEVVEIAITRYFFVIAWALLYLALSYVREVAEAERAASRYAQAAKDAELRSLRYQVNPHFLFNTLNSLSSLVIHKRNDQAEAMIQNLSAFYRNSLSSDPLADVTLSEEVELQKLYLDIETVRYPDRLRIAIDIAPELADLPMPALILQPLVENAIKHGVAASDTPVTLMIKARRHNEKAAISVIDDCTASHIPKAGNGIGLGNVRDRLMARYGIAAQLVTDVAPQGGFVATLYIPIEPL
jgi:two-component system, LytTR family, sensor kinase